MFGAMTVVMLMRNETICMSHEYGKPHSMIICVCGMFCENGRGPKNYNSQETAGNLRHLLEYIIHSILYSTTAMPPF